MRSATSPVLLLTRHSRWARSGRVQIAETARLYQRMEQLPTSDPIRDQIRDSIAADLIGSTKALTEKQSKEFGEFCARMIMVLAERAEKTPQEIPRQNRLTIVRKFNEAFFQGGAMAELVDLSWLKPLPEFRERKPGEPRAEYQAQLMAFKQERRGNEGRVGEGPRPPAWLWHGTLGSHGNLEPKESTTPLRRRRDRVPQHCRASCS